MKIFSIACLICLFAIQASAQSPQVPSEPGADRPAEVEEAGDNKHENSEPAPAAPLEVEVEPVQPVSNEETDEGSEQVADNIFSWLWNHINITNSLIVLFTFFLVLFTRKLSISTERLWEASVEQSKDMKASIKEATRSATAMERVAENTGRSIETVEENMAMIETATTNQMRAYLIVNIGNALFQDEKNSIHFAAGPVLENSGNTPAYNIGITINASIFATPPIHAKDFPLPKKIDSDFAMGPRQQLSLSAYVQKFAPTTDLEAIRSGRGPAFYVWGRITYEDISGEERFTNFCHRITWLSDDTVWGYHHTSHNNAN